MTAERPSTTTVSTLCDRLLRWFILVSATARFAAPRAMMASTSSVHSTDTCDPSQAASALLSALAGPVQAQRDDSSM